MPQRWIGHRESRTSGLNREDSFILEEVKINPCCILCNDLAFEIIRLHARLHVLHRDRFINVSNVLVI